MRLYWRNSREAAAEPSQTRSAIPEKRSVLNTRASQGEAATTYGAGYPSAKRIHGKDEVMFDPD
jgi:hypothetical protein